MEKHTIQRTYCASEIEEQGSIRLSKLRRDLGACKKSAENRVGHAIMAKDCEISIDSAYNEDGESVYIVNFTFTDIETDKEAQDRIRWDKQNFEREKAAFIKFAKDHPGDAQKIMMEAIYND